MKKMKFLQKTTIPIDIQRKILEDLKSYSSENVDEEAAQLWINEGSKMKCYGTLSDCDIMSRVAYGSQETRNFENCFESDEENLLTYQNLTQGDTLVYTELLNKLEQENGSISAENMMLRNLRSKIFGRVNEKRKQTSIIPFFTTQSGTSWPVAAFLLVNAALGAGVLNYPFAYDKAGGVYFAAILQIIMMVILISTMLVLVHCADLNGDNTYHDVLMSMCGRRAQQCAAISILLTCYGICITFLIIIGDQYDRLFLSLFEKDVCNHWYLDRHFTISLTATLFILPMCYFQRLDFLRYASTLGILAMIYPVFLTVYEYYKLPTQPGRVKTMPDSAVQVFVVIPVFSFAYQTHEIVVPVYACMKERSMKSFTKATFLAMGILFVIYCMAGSFGYITFGSLIAPDIMEQYDANDPVVLIGIGALVIKMITTYPQLVLCGRGALDGLYAEFAKLTTDEYIKGEYKRRMVVTTLWFFSTVLLSVLTPNIGVAIELLGCLASVNIFIFPGICLIALVKKEDPSFSNFMSIVKYIVASAMITFGAFVFGVVFSKVFLDMQGSSNSTPAPHKCR